MLCDGQIRTINTLITEMLNIYVLLHENFVKNKLLWLKYDTTLALIWVTVINVRNATMSWKSQIILAYVFSLRFKPHILLLYVKCLIFICLQALNNWILYALMRGQFQQPIDCFSIVLQICDFQHRTTAEKRNSFFLNPNTVKLLITLCNYRKEPFFFNLPL